MTMLGPPQTSSAVFREQAARCRRLANESGNERLAETLLVLAGENDQRAFYAVLSEQKLRRTLDRGRVAVP